MLGKRYDPRQSSDTLKSYNKLPLTRYVGFEEFYESLPYGAKLVGIELSNFSESLLTYNHPDKAVYILGAEDSGLPKYIQDRCHDLIQIPSLHCLNVAGAGTIVMYDRTLKRN